MVSQRQHVFIDRHNSFGNGPTALYSFGGSDKTFFVLVANSIEEYLNNHLQKLRSDWYCNDKGFLETFARNPLNAHGSVTITNGIKISAQA